MLFGVSGKNRSDFPEFTLASPAPFASFRSQVLEAEASALAALQRLLQDPKFVGARFRWELEVL